MSRNIFETSPFLIRQTPLSGGLDWREVFGNDHPVEVEIGFGNGKFIAGMAMRKPESNHLGIEIYNEGIRKLLSRLELENIPNVRVMKGEAIAMIPRLFRKEEIAAMYVNFPDPWPKKRHRRRRLVREAFVELMSEYLKPGGIVHMATDFTDYGEQMMEVFSNSQEFINLAGAGQFMEKDPDRITTRYEERFLKLGQPIYYLAFRKKG